MVSLLSGTWGNKAYEVSQPFGVYNADLAGWYQYAKDYGWPAGTHIGLDVAVPKLTPIYATQPGVVLEAGWSDSFRPNPVKIKEDDGDEAILGHLWEATVSPGQKVKRGQLVGYSGEQTYRGTMTPDGSGPHIHYELRRPDPLTGALVAVDPTYELSGSFDPQNPGNAYTKNPYDQYGWGMDSETVKTGSQRVLIGAAGILVALIGAWALIGNPTSIAGIAKGVLA